MCVHVYVNVCTRGSLCVHVCLYVFVHVCVYVSACVGVWKCVHMYACMCECMCFYICFSTLRICALRRVFSASLQGCIMDNEALTSALLAENLEPTESKAAKLKTCWVFPLHHQSIHFHRSVGCSWGEASVHRKSAFLPRSTSSCFLIRRQGENRHWLYRG